MCKVTGYGELSIFLFILFLFLLLAPALADEYNMPENKSGNESATIDGEDGCCVVPGDANGDGTMNVVDAYYIVCHIFFGCPDYPCHAESDANADGSTGLADASFIINSIFFGGSQPMCGPN